MPSPDTLSLRSTCLRFGACEVRTGTRELHCAARLVPMERRSFDVLVYLIENRERVVSKDELLQSLWGTVNISESAVARMVMKIRRAIGDDTRSPQWLRTVHGVGYRFVGAVECAEVRYPVQKAGLRRLRRLEAPDAAALAQAAFGRALQAAQRGDSAQALAQLFEADRFEPGALIVRPADPTRPETLEVRFAVHPGAHPAAHPGKRDAGAPD